MKQVEASSGPWHTSRACGSFTLLSQNDHDDADDGDDHDDEEEEKEEEDEEEGGEGL